MCTKLSAAHSLLNASSWLPKTLSASGTQNSYENEGTKALGIRYQKYHSTEIECIIFILNRPEGLIWFLSRWKFLMNLKQ